MCSITGASNSPMLQDQKDHGASPQAHPHEFDSVIRVGIIKPYEKENHS